MRKSAAGLCLIGGFLVMLAILGRWYAPGQVMRTPLNVNTTTRLSGTATLNGKTEPIKVTSLTRADSAKSDGNVVSFVSSTCVVLDIGNPPDCVPNSDPQKRLISASVDNFATNRVSAMAVNDQKYLPANATPHDGLVNKFPFNTKKQTYPYWDSTIQKSVPANFVGTRVIDGLTTYQFHVQVDNAPVEVAAGVPGKYSDDKTIYVDPVTGSQINQVETQTRTTNDGKPVIALSFQYTPAQVKTTVDEANANRSQISLVRNVIPLIGFILGIPALLVGLYLGTRKRSGTGAHHGDGEDDTAAYDNSDYAGLTDQHATYDDDDTWQGR